MANNRKITVDDMITIAQDMATKNDARFFKNADAGDLASKDEVTESDLSVALATTINGKANSADLGTLAGKNNVSESELTVALSTKINGKADSSTTLNGYGITDAYTKAEIDGKLSSVYKPGGSKTAAELTSALLIAANEGKVYNASEAITSTAADFTDGGSKTYPAGTNFAVIEVTPADNSDPENPVSATYKFDALAGFVDLSGYAQLEDVETASAADITAICNGYFGADDSSDDDSDGE